MYTYAFVILEATCSLLSGLAVQQITSLEKRVNDM
jgi:hypothetical protein